jgi:hypothetical protein
VWRPEHVANLAWALTGIAATQFDPKSIMLYSFDGALFSDGLGPTNENTVLSPLDMAFIKSMYPQSAPSTRI